MSQTAQAVRATDPSINYLTDQEIQRVAKAVVFGITTVLIPELIVIKMVGSAEEVDFANRLAQVLLAISEG